MSGVFATGPFEFDAASGLLYRGEQETLLPLRAAKVLAVLLRRPGEVLCKDELLNTVWEGAFVGEDSLTQAISMVRSALGDDPRNPTYIQTIPKRGYRFIAEVVGGGEGAGEAQPSGATAASGAVAPAAPFEPTTPSAAAPTRPAPPGASTRLGNYEILAEFGAGAMGVVYRAHDTVLDRDVAIKVLADEFIADADRVARFEREAKLLASLNHPNIAAIHSLEEADGIKFPVLELVEGATLEERLRAKLINVEHALEYGRQIASALEAAHERGIVHRDLKPANIKITPEGQIKVLDFGLAKALEVKVFGADVTESPTASMTIIGSRRGAIIGTAAYMSPEQARGQEADRRADIWSFGCVLFEMLAGKRAFAGETVSDTIAGLLQREPDWEALPAETPWAARRVLRRCLSKDAEHRLHDIADARIELEEALAEPEKRLPTAPTGDTFSPWRRATPWVMAAAFGVAAIAFGALWSVNRIMPGETPAHLLIDVEPGGQLWGGHATEVTYYGLQRPTRTSIAFSPDGNYLVYAATMPSADATGALTEYAERGQLYLRWLQQERARPILGTERGASPFVSPDGAWIGFYAQRAGGHYDLKKVAVAGGEPRTILADAPEPYGASWADNGTILFPDGDSGGIVQVPDAGGSLRLVTTLDRGRGETAHRLPHMLPGSEALLFTIRRGKGWDGAQIAVQSVEGDEHEVLIENGADARYVPTGHIVFVRRGTLMAAPFDLENLERTGEPVRVVEDVMQAAFNSGSGHQTGAGQFSISGSGSLAYVPGGIHPELEQALVWTDREGNQEALPIPLGEYRYPRISPDGQRLAYAAGQIGATDIYVYDFQRQTAPRRLTFDGEDRAPVWSPDGTRIAFASDKDGGELNLYWVAADGGEPERLTTSDQPQMPSSWSQEGALVFVEGFSNRQGDIWVLAMDGEREPSKFPGSSPFAELYPALSPNERWLAYSSDETGQAEVYVRPYPGPGPPTLVSTEGGDRPAWSKDGREIFYRIGGRTTMAVEVIEDGTLSVGRPQHLFTKPVGATMGVRNYDVADDGRFATVTIREQEPHPATRINIILNWFEELERLVPRGQ
jgi:serine/threonine-protein kinase